MKKAYINPEMITVRVKPSMICTSIQTYEETKGAKSALSREGGRGGSVWDDEEDE